MTLQTCRSKCPGQTEVMSGTLPQTPACVPAEFPSDAAPHGIATNC